MHMWRAWGITLLALFPAQDLGPAYSSDLHEMRIRPPAGWLKREGQGNFIARFQAPGESKDKPSTHLTLAHLSYSATPTPLRSFVAQAKEHIAKEYKDSKITEEKELAIGGRPAYRIVFTFQDTLQVKHVIPRTNLECYLVDGQTTIAEAEKTRPLIEASAASFEIVPMTPTPEETQAQGRLQALLKEARVRPELLGETWYSVYIGKARSGHQRIKVAASEGVYSFEVDLANDYGEGGKDSTIVRGSFSPDGRTQKVDLESTKQGPKERWQFRANATIQNGQARASRDMNGVKEEKAFPVEDGVLFTDVADLVRRTLVFAGKGTYLFRTLSPFADEPNAELLEVNPREPLDLDGKKREGHIVFGKTDRRKNSTYYVGADGAALRTGGLKDAFSIRLSTKEEATK
jgi:hypothetical protein